MHPLLRMLFLPILWVFALNFDFRSAIAQEESNYKFYPHDYAKSTFEKKGQPSPAATGTPKAKTTNGKATAGKSTSPNPVVGVEPTGKAIESLSLIIDNLNLLELKRCLEVLLNIYNEKTVRPAKIFMIGVGSPDYPKEVELLIQRLNMLGIQESVDSSPPKNFQVTKSPAWIITLKEGDIVLEGVDSPARFINSKGEFIDPKEVKAGFFEGGEE